MEARISMLVLLYALPVSVLAAAASTTSCTASNINYILCGALASSALHPLCASLLSTASSFLSRLSLALGSASCTPLPPSAPPPASAAASAAAGLLCACVGVGACGGLLGVGSCVVNDVCGWVWACWRGGVGLLVGHYVYQVLGHPQAALADYAGRGMYAALWLPHALPVVVYLGSITSCGLPPYVCIVLVPELHSALLHWRRALVLASIGPLLALDAIIALSFLPLKIGPLMWLLVRVSGDHGSLHPLPLLASLPTRSILILWLAASLLAAVRSMALLLFRALTPTRSHSVSHPT